ncbi:hypothetical protein AU152_gp76 [Mycobacterium phage Phlei]|uniref:Uncharacterized protein n=1 Tax=Mycobacterium phage Phlei TaxID=1690684 RepID=A0A0N9BDN7_9CAUD|nr:hypothetical protein AU152_gp76 [Mycobacterium phage Phlei]ALA48189.1 hypothetical protein [Mycobacterium phage Phlei]
MGMSSYYEVVQVTLEESSCVTTSRTFKDRHNSVGEAFAAAVDLAQALAGPERDGWRRPKVSIELDETFGLVVKVGDSRVDAEYHVFRVSETKSIRESHDGHSGCRAAGDSQSPEK